MQSTTELVQGCERFVQKSRKRESMQHIGERNRKKERFGSRDLPLERITKFQTYVSRNAFNNIFFQFSGKLGDSERQEHDVRE